MPSHAAPLAAVAAVARPIVERVVWATVTTVGEDRRPRSRLMHPVWFWDDHGAHALVTARPTPIKVRHLGANPWVACFYWDPAHDTVEVDATARWLEPDERAAAWAAIERVPGPVGFDPALVWPEGPASPDCRFLRFDATRIVTARAAEAALRWSAP